jgi:hypothetical protein
MMIEDSFDDQSYESYCYIMNLPVTREPASTSYLGCPSEDLKKKKIENC